jgi:hypothetical protein
MRPVRCVSQDHQMSTINTGMHVIKAFEAFNEFGRLTVQEFADYADIGRYDAHAVLARMRKPTKAGLKRIYVADWTYEHDDARRYPRAVYMLGDKEDKKKPKPDIRLNRQRSEHKAIKAIRMTSVFNMGLTRDKVREIRRSL